MQFKRITQTLAVLGSGTLVAATSPIASAELSEVSSSNTTRAGHAGCGKTSGGNKKAPDQPNDHSKKQPGPNEGSHEKPDPENRAPKKPKKKKGEDKCGQGTCG